MIIKVSEQAAKEFQKAAQEIEKTLGKAAPSAEDLVSFHLRSAHSEEMVELFHSTISHIVQNKDENTLPLPLEEV